MALSFFERVNNTYRKKLPLSLMPEKTPYNQENYHIRQAFIHERIYTHVMVYCVHSRVAATSRAGS